MQFEKGSTYMYIGISGFFWKKGSTYVCPEDGYICTELGDAQELKLEDRYFRKAKPNEKPTVSRDTTKSTYEFKVSSPDAICHSEIYKGLTRVHPVAIVKRSDGMHYVIVHESLEDKSCYVEDALRDEYMEAMEPYWSDGYQPYSSGTLKKLLKVLKKLKVAPYKSKRELTCHVELLSI